MLEWKSWEGDGIPAKENVDAVQRTHSDGYTVQRGKRQSSTVAAVGTNYPRTVGKLLCSLYRCHISRPLHHCPLVAA